jgi:hypothetical protein
MHSMLVERTGGSGQPTFNSAVMAFVDMPGVTQALGFAAGTVAADVSTGASLLMNMKRAFDPGGDLASTGPRFKQKRAVAESTAPVIYGAGLNEASVTRVTGMS